MLDITTETTQLYKVKVNARTNLAKLLYIRDIDQNKNDFRFLYASFDTSKIDNPYSFVRLTFATRGFIKENQSSNKFQLVGTLFSFKDENGDDFEIRLIKERESKIRAHDFYDIEMRFSKTFLIDRNGLIIKEIKE